MNRQISGEIWGISGAANYWACGGCISGKIVNLKGPKSVYIHSNNNACKLLVNNGQLSEYIFNPIKANDGSLSVEFRVNANEFFSNTGIQKIRLIEYAEKNLVKKRVLSDFEITYCGPTVETFSCCDLDLKYLVQDRILILEGHFISWRDPIFLGIKFTNITPSIDIKIEPNQIDQRWLADKIMYFPHHVDCRFSKSLRINRVNNKITAYLYGWFGMAKEVLLSKEIAIG
jgi:hypothetical protein